MLRHLWLQAPSHTVAGAPRSDLRRGRRSGRGRVRSGRRSCGLSSRRARASWRRRGGSAAMSKCPLPWQCPSSAPVPPQGAPGGSGQLGTPRERPTHWVPSHCPGCSSQPPPKLPIPPRLTMQAAAEPRGTRGADAADGGAGGGGCGRGARRVGATRRVGDRRGARGRRAGTPTLALTLTQTLTLTLRLRLKLTLTRTTDLHPTPNPNPNPIRRALPPSVTLTLTLTLTTDPDPDPDR